MLELATTYARQSIAAQSVYDSIKKLCSRVGINVDAAESFAEYRPNIVLPWYAEVSPEMCILSSAQILQGPPKPNDHCDDIVYDLKNSEHGTAHIGVLGILPLVDNNRWSSTDKRAFMRAFFNKHLDNIYTRSFNQPQLANGATHAMLSWFANDILTLGSLYQTTVLTNAHREILNLIPIYEIKFLAEVARLREQHERRQNEVIKLTGRCLQELLTNRKLDYATATGLTDLLDNEYNNFTTNPEKSGLAHWFRSRLDEVYPDTGYTLKLSNEIINRSPQSTWNATPEAELSKQDTRED